jgi:hypothetical protein
MPPDPSDSRLACLAAALAAAALLAAACSETPSEPEFTNPFDPNAPGYDGNPLQLTSSYDENTASIRLRWQHTGTFGITTYQIRHATAAGGPYDDIGSVPAPADPGNVQYYVEEPVRNAVNYFKVVGVNAAGSAMATSVLVPDSLTAPPFLDILGGRTEVASRRVRLLVTTGVGDQVRLADNRAFTGPSLVERPALPGETDTVAWDFGPASPNETLGVYLQVLTGGVGSPIDSVTPRVEFAPGFSAFGDPPTVATNVLELEVDTTGVVQMRFARSEEELVGAAWEPPAPVRPGYQLTDDLATQTIYGEFEGDFGFNAVTTTTVTPDDLGGASFEIVFPDPGDRVLESSIVELSNTAVATQMRFAAGPDFSGVAWQPYADTYELDAGPGAGERVVYGQFRNYWTTSAVLTDWFIQIGLSLEITILAPADSAIVRGGTALLTRGTSRADPDGPGIAFVELFPEGAADWEIASGTTDWTWLWEVPRFDEDTWLNLRARVVTGVDPVTSLRDTLTTAVVVLVTDPRVTIEEPAAGAEIPAATEVTVSGTAAPAVGGAAIDSVAVAADGERLAVSGTTTWSTSWTAPDAVAPTEFELVATAFAGGETAADTVRVTVLPPERR